MVTGEWILFTTGFSLQRSLVGPFPPHKKAQSVMANNTFWASDTVLTQPTLQANTHVFDF